MSLSEAVARDPCSDVVREIASLTRLAHHPFVVDLKKVFVYENDAYLVCLPEYSVCLLMFSWFYFATKINLFKMNSL